MSWDLSDDNSTLVQVMAWCHQAASHYLSQCWLRAMLAYSITIYSTQMELSDLNLDLRVPDTGQLKHPWGVATDGENILVADSGNKRIQVFKIDGMFVSIIASEDDPLQDPAGLESQRMFMWQIVKKFVSRCTSTEILQNSLTLWGRVMHICLSRITIIGSDNGLFPGRCQGIIWTNAGILLMRTLGINFSEI